jgi:hypothetical protein
VRYIHSIKIKSLLPLIPNIFKTELSSWII